jgi:hypothetical protein
MCLWCCWKDLDEQDLKGIYLVKIWIQNVGAILIFKVISATEKIQINSKEPGFGRKKSVENVVTLGPTAQATLVALSSVMMLLCRETLPDVI